MNVSTLIVFIAIALVLGWWTKPISGGAMMMARGGAKKCQKSRLLGRFGFNYESNVLNPTEIVIRQSVGYVDFHANNSATGVTIVKYSNLSTDAVRLRIVGNWAIDDADCSVLFYTDLTRGGFKGYFEMDGTISMFTKEMSVKGVLRMRRTPRSGKKCELKRMQGKYSYIWIGNKASLSPYVAGGYDVYNKTKHVVSTYETNPPSVTLRGATMDVAEDCIVTFSYADGSTVVGVIVDNYNKIFFMQADKSGFGMGYGAKSH